MVEIASFVLDVVKCLAAPIGRPFMYLYNYKKNIDNLQGEVRKLKYTREEVQVKVVAAERNVEKIKQSVKDWQSKVNNTIIEAEKLIEEKENNPRCFQGLCPNWITRYKLSRKSVGLKLEDIGPLLQQEKEFTEVAHPTNPPEIWLRSDNEDYLVFESRTSTEKNVWDALNDENIYMIGVYGMGGLGKTTLVQEVCRKAEKDKLFEEIVFVEVTETLDVKKLQKEIANKLGMNFNNESEITSKLYERLNNGKKILLILDNIWEDLDLKTIGIPSKMDRGGCKLLLTTRNLDALQKMDSAKNFGMSVLEEEEAWKLFTKMAGNVIRMRELNSLPNDVCKECGGLPIVICTIAKALRNRRQKSQWEDALRILRMPSPAKFTRLLEREYSKIKLSYDYLEHDELKKTFIISSLMENNTSISDLFKNIASLGILEGANLTIEQARNRLDLVVKELKESCLLLDGSTKERYSMHDVVRIVAITCGYIDHHVFTERNDIEGEWKDKDKLRKCTIISLVGNNIITQLWHEGLDCPELEFFYMKKKGSSFKIPEEFFKVMPKLKVLNLFRIQQSSLPSSLDLLTNLQTLCLDNSKLQSVAIIGKLKKLKVLSLQNSNIRELSIEMAQLVGLKLLDLSNCRQLEVIVPNLISKLLQLEELYIKGCCIQWNAEVLKELKNLSQLTSLEIDIEDNKMLPTDFFSKELKKFKISIGDWSSPYARMGNKWLNSFEFSRILEFKYDSTISLEELQIFKNLEVLRLDEFSNDDKNLMPVFNKKVIFSNLMGLELKVTSSRKIWDSQPPTFMYSLTGLTLKGCGNIKYGFPFCIAKSLRSLQHLEIRDCEVLEEIVAEEEGAKTIVNFAFLRVTFLKLENLPKFTAFYHGIDTWELPMLKELVVKHCEKFTSKYLIFHENSHHKSLWLDNKINSDLEELDLENKFRHITWQRSKTLTISNDNSANIPVRLLQRFEKLEELQLRNCRYKDIFASRNDEKMLQITLGPSSPSFQNLKVLKVLGCRELMKLMTPSMARSLVQLREMSIKGCEMLIEIVENERDTTTSTEIVFENLKKLSLRELKILTCFCSGNYSFNFPSLEVLNIGECPNMKTFSRSILSTPKLEKVNYEKIKYWSLSKNSWTSEKMEVENEGNYLNKTIQGAYKKQDISLELKLWTFKDINSTEICYNQHPNSFYQNLTHLFLWNCENIKCVFPSFIAKSLHQLRHLQIRNCKVLEEIVGKGVNEDDKFVFPHVFSLKLENLPKFTGFYHIFEWPMLKELVVKYCDKFITSKYLSFQENKECELHISEPKSLFLDDKINSNLEEMELWNENGMIEWQSQSKFLRILGNLSANIPIRLLQRFKNLKQLNLELNEYTELFFPNIPNLEVLAVSGCYRLMSLVPSSTSFLNLKGLTVDNCSGLMKLITPSTARSLVQLRELDIEFCDMLIEIVENEGYAKTTEIVFDNLKKLSLKYLKSLTCFCSGNYSFNFPSLEEFIIGECPNMKTFSQEILSTPKLHKIHYEDEEKDLDNGGSDLNTTIQQAHKVQVDFNFKELTLSGRDIMSIWEGEFQESFGKVKTLQLIKDDYANIPIQIIHKFNSLEKLILKVSSYEEIFSCGDDEEHVEALTKLKYLKLQGLFNLRCIWKQDSWSNLILQNLDHLEVHYCHNLTTLLPSLASFENLRTLRVRHCNGMKNLISSSTTKSLMRLEHLSIVECEMMVEVLANEGDIEKCEVVFEKLKKLELWDLRSLTCFCCEDYTLKFPNLENLHVPKCFKMKTFSGRDLSMPRLKKLNYKSCSESDIDIIIQQLQNDCSVFCERLWRGGDIHQQN